MKFEQTKVSLNYLNTETNQKWCRYHGLLPSQLEVILKRPSSAPFVAIHGDTSAPHGLAEAPQCGMFCPSWMTAWQRSCTVYGGCGRCWSRCFTWWQIWGNGGQGKVSMFMTWSSFSTNSSNVIKDEGLCCSRTMPVLMLPEECKKKKKKRRKWEEKKRERTHTNPHTSRLETCRTQNVYEAHVEWHNMNTKHTFHDTRSVWNKCCCMAL